MSDFFTGLLARPRLVVATALLLALAGAIAWATMPREEDPQFPHRNGLVIANFPGADAETVERLLVEPLEERLAEVEEIRDVSSTARAGTAILRIEMLDAVYDTDSAWDEVAAAVDRARADFPEGVPEPIVQDDLVSQEAVVLAVTGAADPLVLAATAERLKRELISLSAVKQVKLVADPGEQITIEYDDATAHRLGIDPRLLGRQLQGRSTILPGGVIHLGAKTANLRPQTDFASLDEIRRTPILLPSGSSVPLGELARVRRGPREPAGELMRWQGEPAVGLGVVPKDGIDRVAFGADVRRRLAELRSELAPLRVEEVVFQPDHVKARLAGLTSSLRLGILIVAVLLFWAMGWRMGVLVALVVPLVAFAAIALFATFGGILHQISIAALVIALGMLVDNAIVMVENIQWRLDRGLPGRQAAAEAVRELAVPLGTATGTTLAAFVPMLVSRGGTADFTRSLPVLIMLTLSLSYLFAVLVTPVVAGLLLRRNRRATPAEGEAPLAERAARFAVSRPGWVLGGAVLLLALTAVAARWVDRQFFPAADRTTAIVDLQMPEGTHVDETDAVSRTVERALMAHPDVASVATYVGRAVPKFYYNLLSRPNSPHRAQLMVEARDLEAVGPLLDWTRDFVRRELPEVEVVARRLEQGPAVEAPVEIRVLGSDLAAMEEAADAVLAELRQIPGTRDVRHDLGLGAPTVAFQIDDAAAGRFGLTRADVATVLLGRTLGSEIGQYRVGDDPVPILVRSSAGEELPVSELETVAVAAPGGDPVPLSQLARLEIEWRPAAISHYQRTRVVKVMAQLGDGTTTQEVLAQLAPRLAQLALPAGVRLQVAGEVEESGKANAAILSTMPLGVLLLLFFLLAEFNSFRRVAIVLTTVPLAAIGVVPGLLLSQQPFGFMSLLGVIALVGIVVNNAIVLLDVIESLRGEGFPMNEALLEAVKRRTRPIFLTMGTTVAGLSPLAFTSTTLWPPLAWAMISGLIASTVLTLMVVPALYKVLFTPRQGTFFASLRRRRARLASATPLVLAVLALAPLGARAVLAEDAVAAPEVRLTLAEAMAEAAARPQARAAAARATAAERLAEVERRRAFWPSVGVSADAVFRDRDYDFDTPLGSFTLGDRQSDSTAVQVSQPLLDPAPLFYGVPAARSEAAAEAARAARIRQLLAAEAARRFLDVLALDAAMGATETFIDSLSARLAETEERVAAGRSLEADALKVRLDLEAAELDRVRLRELRALATLELGRAIGRPGAVEPVFDGVYDREPTPSVEELAAASAAGRPDLAALVAQLEARELRARAVRAERWPSLAARASWVRSDGDPFRPDELVEGAIGVTWRPFAAGTRAPRIAALEAERDALEADLDELRRTVELDIRGALVELQTARYTLAVRQRGVELATETLRVERERHNAGRATTNDLLAAEATLRQQRTQNELSRLDVLRAWTRLELAAGVELMADRDPVEAVPAE